MAESYAHKFGQIIGDLIELILVPRLKEFAEHHDLYLDKKGPRNARGQKVLVVWQDANGNEHRLDFVLERGGTEDKIGSPVAFIESAWRRGTRHSKNKVQEIQAAINPIVLKYASAVSFKGAILAGDFTTPSITQLVRDNFSVLYFPTEICVKAFQDFGLEIKSDDDTGEDVFISRIQKWETFDKKNELADVLLELNKENVDEFFGTLTKSISRSIKQVIVYPLHGKESNLNNLDEAVEFLRSYEENKSSKLQFIKYEILIKYDNNDRIDASFTEKKAAIEFLEIHKLMGKRNN